MRQILSLLIPTLLLTQQTQGVAIDNNIVGSPTIECRADQVFFTIATSKGFSGRVFAKSRAADPACSGFAQGGSAQASISLPLGLCGMKNTRSTNPRGMYYGVTVVVSFHPLILTKVDQAFHVKCFFEEQSHGVTADIAVSMMPSTEAAGVHQGQPCTYSIHSIGPEGLLAGSTLGPEIQYARIGDKVVHKWECADPMFGILVNHCYVTDGSDERASVIDANGCPVDPIMLTSIRYSSGLNAAFAESHVFKFADKPGVWFFCQIQMCMKDGGMCNGITPPRCSTPTDFGGPAGPTDFQVPQPAEFPGIDEHTAPAFASYVPTYTGAPTNLGSPANAPHPDSFRYTIPSPQPSVAPPVYGSAGHGAAQVYPSHSNQNIIPASPGYVKRGPFPPGQYPTQPVTYPPPIAPQQTAPPVPQPQPYVPPPEPAGPYGGPQHNAFDFDFGQIPPHQGLDFKQFPLEQLPSIYGQGSPTYQSYDQPSKAAQPSQAGNPLLDLHPTSIPSDSPLRSRLGLGRSPVALRLRAADAIAETQDINGQLIVYDIDEDPPQYFQQESKGTGETTNTPFLLDPDSVDSAVCSNSFSVVVLLCFSIACSLALSVALCATCHSRPTHQRTLPYTVMGRSQNRPTPNPHSHTCSTRTDQPPKRGVKKI